MQENTKKFLWVIAVILFLGLYFYIPVFLQDSPTFKVNDANTRQSIVNLTQLSAISMSLFSIYKGFFTGRLI